MVEGKRFIFAIGVLGRLDAARIAADLVERGQREVDVESGVFKALGHDRAGELLPAANESQARLALLGTNMPRSFEKQDIRKKIERSGELWATFARAADRRSQDRLSILGDFQSLDICAIDGKARGGFDERFGQFRRAEFARVTVARSELGKVAAKRAHFDAQQRAHDELLFLIERVLESGRLTEPARIDTLKSCGLIFIDEKTICEIKVVVARRAVDEPVSGRPFSASENLFDNEI